MMTRYKIDYGIDLGTTNSSIARIDNGVIHIIKTTWQHMDTLPSAVHFTKSGDMLVGLRAYDKMRRERENRENTFIEFKRNMGNDKKYYSSRKNRSYSSEELSSEILKELKSSVRDDDDIMAAVITVPADFMQVQIAATQKAAEMAGFQYCELLQEPIAASLAYGYDTRRTNAVWVVFDFGGGTFDAALVKVQDGILRVIDHSGDNHLGGKDMDELIVSELIIPHLQKYYAIERVLQNKDEKNNIEANLKHYAEEAKISLSNCTDAHIEPDQAIGIDDNGKPIEFRIEFSRREFEDLIRSIIDRAIGITIDLISRNRPTSNEIDTILLVGGPTYIPYLRNRIREEISPNIDVSIDPMTVVAIGAALYASTCSIPRNIQGPGQRSKVQLILIYPAMTLETEINLGIRVDRGGTKGKCPSRVFVQISRRDQGWATGKIEIEGDSALVPVRLRANDINAYNIQVYDEYGMNYECEPEMISVIQGVKISDPILPHDIGIAVVKRDGGRDHPILIEILKKNQPLPAEEKGTFYAPKMIRPGRADDILNIFVYEGERDTIAARNEYAGVVIITGERFASLLPEGSEIQITIKMDKSRRIVVSAFFPFLDETIEKVLDTDYRQGKIKTEEIAEKVRTAQGMIESLGNSEEVLGENLSVLIRDCEAKLKENRGLIGDGIDDENYDRGSMVKSRLNELLKKLDKADTDFRWPRLEKKMKDETDLTEETVERHGSDGEQREWEILKEKSRHALDIKDEILVEGIIENIIGLRYRIWFRQESYWVWVFNAIAEQYDAIKWTDKTGARSLLGRGKEMMAKGQSGEIQAIVKDLWGLMPDEDKRRPEAIRDDIPHY